jgi:HTH-type transcriptional regulator/antitoxin HigA
LRIGELEAQKTECPPFQKKLIEKMLPQLRSLTMEPPKSFEKKLKNKLLNAGVVLVLRPHLPKTYAHGATFWLEPAKAVLLLTLRGSWADIFWFSLFHEIGHLLLHKRQSVFLEVKDFNPECKKQEKEADDFAAKILIPPSQYQNFVNNGSFYEKDIKNFAQQLKIDPGIVVGRLQHDRLLDRAWQNKLRKRFIWSEKKPTN